MAITKQQSEQIEKVKTALQDFCAGAYERGVNSGIAGHGVMPRNDFFHAIAPGPDGPMSVDALNAAWVWYKAGHREGSKLFIDQVRKRNSRGMAMGLSAFIDAVKKQEQNK